MAEATFACPKCKMVFGVAPGTDHLEAACPTCSSQLAAFFFPAFLRAPEIGAAPTALLDHTEASCFYHPQKQAARVCDGCGRLMCALCSIELGTEHLCPACISSGRKKGKITTLEGNRTRYDSIALSLAVFGLFVYVFAIFVGPTAIYISIRHWNTPGSLLGVRKSRFVIAIILGVMEIVAWFALFGLIIYQLTMGHHR